MKHFSNKSVLLLAMLLILGKEVFAQFDYDDALEKSIYFFDANKCGPDVGDSNVFSWRGACHVTDGSAAGIDLSGGFHDAGDHVKFGLPQAWTAATLGFALYEFKDAFDESGSTNKLLSILKYFTDYFLKSHTDTGTFYYNIGDGNADHGYWGTPENQSGARPLIAANASDTGSDVCGQAAAALALMYLNYQDVDVSYANQCLQAAIEIYAIGLNNPGRSDDGGGGNFYRSSSHYDDLIWGAIWLSVATGDNDYLDPVDAWFDIPNDYGDDPYAKRWAPAWDDATMYSMIKMYDLTGVDKYRAGVLDNLEWYRDDLQKTPHGLPWLDQWGVLRYASAEAGLGFLAAKFFDYAGYLETGDLTIDYILGDNPRNSSYITGWGTNPPVHPHHRANEPVRGGATNGIVGALVGGPGLSDDYVDNVNDYIKNEVAIDYNASFILGLAGKNYFLYNDPPLPNILPEITLTAPTSGQSIEQGTSITFAADASDSDGSISKVIFLVDGVSVGEDVSSPYTLEWAAPLAGQYEISARALDDRSGAAVSSSVSLQVTSNLGNPTTPNLALNKTATSSSNENGGFSAANAVDGDNQSRWSSEFSDPQWIAIDLGEVFTINRVILRWETAYGSAYQIQISDNGTSWSDVISVPGNGGEDDIIFGDVQTRYIRMYGTQRGTSFGYSIHEFEVYGEDSIDTPPVAVASASPTVGNAPLEVFFDGTASSDPNNSQLSYSWDFGDGTSANGATATHVFSEIGNYEVVLTVSNAEGFSDSDSLIITVTDPDTNTDPVAQLVAEPTQGSVPLFVSFDASDSYDVDGDTLTFSWDFGDGTFGSGSQVTHEYTSIGDFMATVTVTDGNGGSDNAFQNISVISGGGGDCRFGTPLSAPLPTTGYQSYKNIYVLGTGGPDLSNVTDFTINWNLQNNGLYQFSMLTNNGTPDWWNDFLGRVTQNFASTSPQVTITASGFTGLDGSYYVAIDQGNFAMVSVNEDFTLYFSTSSTPPDCDESKSLDVTNTKNQLVLFPNPVKSKLNIYNLVDVSHIAVMNILGKEIINEEIRSNTHQLNFEDQKSGVYIINLIFSDGSITRSIVIKE